MAQAQKLVGIGGIERFTGFTGQVAQFSPSVLDKIDADQLIDVYGDMTSVNPSIIRTDEKVQEMRAAQAQAQAQQQQLVQAQQAAAAAKDLSQSKMDDSNVLSMIAGGGS